MPDLTIFADEAVFGILKLAMLVFLGVYIVFAVIVVKQVNLMTETVKVGFELPIKLFAVTHLLVAIAAFFITLLI